ncbi:MAG: hypothetical protein AAB570_02750 [Patescibacteria group bacterium]
MILTAALLAGCAWPLDIIVERKNPTMSAEISYSVGSPDDVLLIKLDPPYVGVDGREIQYGDELTLVATEGSLTVTSKGWVARSVYGFKIPSRSFKGAVWIANKRGEMVVSINLAKVDPTYLGRRHYNLVLIDPSSGSATASH